MSAVSPTSWWCWHTSDHANASWEVCRQQTVDYDGLCKSRQWSINLGSSEAQASSAPSSPMSIHTSPKKRAFPWSTTKEETNNSKKCYQPTSLLSVSPASGVKSPNGRPWIQNTNGGLIKPASVGSPFEAIGSWLRRCTVLHKSWKDGTFWHLPRQRTAAMKETRDKSIIYIYNKVCHEILHGYLLWIRRKTWKSNPTRHFRE